MKYSDPPKVVLFQPGYEPKIEPCDFCKSKDIDCYMQANSVWIIQTYKAPLIRFFVQCSNCGAESSGAVSHGLEGAVDDWNSRRKSK